ncbi:MAG: hypothetical protein Q7R63_00465 [bacterium]|nr:hypothetical protein [bacterium]
MNNPLQEHLKSLKGIRPDAAFLVRSRARLLTAIAPAPRRFSLESLMPALRMSFATAALSLLVFVSAQQPAKSPDANEVIASLDTVAIQAEQMAVNATGSAANAEYFKGVSPAISLALTDIADPSTNWGSANQVRQSLAVLYKDN